jgi:hypothetical protein
MRAREIGVDRGNVQRIEAPLEGQADARQARGFRPQAQQIVQLAAQVGGAHASCS